jgi:hypothetical protein
MLGHGKVERVTWGVSQAFMLQLLEQQAAVPLSPLPLLLLYTVILLLLVLLLLLLVLVLLLVLMLLLALVHGLLEVEALLLLAGAPYGVESQWRVVG